MMKEPKEIYLDYAAATPTDPRVLEAMQFFMTEKFGNASGLYARGRNARMAIEESREKISAILGCFPEEIYFTGGGTESDNMAILGSARANSSKGKHIIISAIEHHAVLYAAKKLEKEGFELEFVPVDGNGIVNIEKLTKLIRNDTILISVMYANNEIGTIQPIKEIGKIAKDKGIIFHTDACQAASLLSLKVDELGVDLMTVNGSKIYGPQGIGILFKRKSVKIEPILYGGGQESGVRSGTENLAGIVGLAKALEIADKEKSEETKRLQIMRDYLIEKILQNVPKTRLNGDEVKRLASNAHFSILDIEGEALLLYLDKEGIAASTGSACTAGDLRPSHVILALGLSYEAAHGSLRLSMGRFTTKADLDKVIAILPGIVKKLRAMSPLNLSPEDFERSN
jgi:cysteine desulfurase